MRTLFLKIFVGFWLVIALLVISASVIRTASRSTMPGHDPGGPIAFLGDGAANAYVDSGAVGLSRFMSRRPGSTPAFPAYLVDSTGHDVLGRAIPSDWASVARGALGTGEPEVLLKDRRVRVIARPVRARNGTRFVLLTPVPERAPMLLLMPPGAQWPIVITVVVIGGVFSLVLSWHITSPVVRLRRAVRALARGDLSARSGNPATSSGDELVELGRDFDIMADRIESLVEAQRQLLLDVSHELRSPLARLHVALGLARQNGAEGQGEALDRIEREAARLNVLIGRLLMLSRLEADATPAALIPVDLSKLARAVASDADYEARGSGKWIDAQIPDGIIVQGVPSLLASALENVVRNAIRFTQPGHCVSLSAAREAIGARRCVVIRVRDHGPGVPEEDLGKLFHPFHRADPGGGGTDVGFGLGLAITERAVRIHGGTVHAANATPSGLIVEIRLPEGPTPEYAELIGLS